ncbi:hypothetical protein B0H10DRAFT_2374199 [Mycena sp. CBHHK59/15]|nr:hypothetical protein B0H10DRAFT_2374199 [Mycena sp. CBHHK59/15]
MSGAQKWTAAPPPAHPKPSRLNHRDSDDRYHQCMQARLPQAQPTQSSRHPDTPMIGIPDTIGCNGGCVSFSVGPLTVGPRDIKGLKTYLADLIHKIETIKCATEWNAKTGPGSGSFKNDFNTALYQPLTVGPRDIKGLKTYLADLIHKIETIKCATEWNAKTGPGSGSFKNDFNTALYQRENDVIFRHLSAREKKSKMKQQSADFILFKKSREQLVTARNRLLFAYNNISSVFSSAIQTHPYRFGTGVLIHHFFSTANLGQKRAKKFKSLLDALKALAPPSQARTAGRNHFDDLEQGNRDVLYTLTSALCTTEEEKEKIAEHLDNFFILYPSSVRT